MSGFFRRRSPDAVQIGILGNPGSWYCDDLQRAAAELGHSAARLDFPLLTARMGHLSPPLSCAVADVTQFDAVIVRTMPPGSLEQVVYRMDALASLEAAGVTVLNPPKAIECAVDKYLATLRLEAAGLTVPETIVCEDCESAMEAFEQLGRDVVVKPIFGAEGRGILRVSHVELAWRTFRTLQRLQAVLFLQRFVEHTYDTRALVLDGQVIGGMRRYANGDFRTNVAQRGRAERCELSRQERDWALRAVAAVGARFAGVDLLLDVSGKRFVIEVNAVPGWRAFTKVSGQDVARMVVNRLAATTK